MKIGVLGLQGAFSEHVFSFKKLGICSVIVKNEEDLNNCTGLVIPGGESTTIGKLLIKNDLLDVIKKKIELGMPVFGTCAGLLLLAKKVPKRTTPSLSCMDIVAERNAFGRQSGSFATIGNFMDKQIPMVFIRAPYIKNVSDKTIILSTVKGKIVAAEEANILVTAFHPELTNDLSVHKYFLKMCCKYGLNHSQ